MAMSYDAALIPYSLLCTVITMEIVLLHGHCNLPLQTAQGWKILAHPTAVRTTGSRPKQEIEDNQPARLMSGKKRHSWI